VRKKKKKYTNLIMLLLILFALFFVVLQTKTIKVTADELIENYKSNVAAADSKYLNQKIEISGTVNTLVQLEGKDNFLELQSNNEQLKIYCLLPNTELVESAALITTGTSVNIHGKCLGLRRINPGDTLKIIYIATDSFK
jgi:tRNA(Ile2) C34 agmatinyltransferase TiaS